jgi:hypothetical protein
MVVLNDSLWLITFDITLKEKEVGMKKLRLYFVLLLLPATTFCSAQNDTLTHHKAFKNVIRYNLSGAMLFGIDKYIVLGYERIVAPKQSFSINVGHAVLPRPISIITDSFSLSRDINRTGYNVSVDYRFYLGKENKFPAPHGLYIGPYYSYNHFERSDEWRHQNNSANSSVTTFSKFNINTIGFELGYQFILWKRLALDFIMFGPGLGFYNYKTTFNGNIDAATQEQLLDGLKQLLTQKFPGMNFVFSDKQFDANGVLNTNTMGYRYIIHIGYIF